MGFSVGRSDGRMVLHFPEEANGDVISADPGPSAVSFSHFLVHSLRHDRSAQLRPIIRVPWPGKPGLMPSPPHPHPHHVMTCPDPGKAVTRDSPMATRSALPRSCWMLWLGQHRSVFVLDCAGLGASRGEADRPGPG